MRTVVMLLLGVAAGGCGERPLRAPPPPVADPHPAPSSAARSPPEPIRRPTTRPAADVAVMVMRDDPPVPPGPPPPPASPIDPAAAVQTPACLGFLPGGRAAYVLVANNDPSIPEWHIRVDGLGETGSPDLAMTLKTRDPQVARARFAGLVTSINAFLRDRKLIACTAATAGPGGILEATVGVIPTRISYDAGALVIAPAGRPPTVRPETETTDLSLVAAYTAGPLLAVVLRDHLEGGMVVERTEWLALE